MQVRYALLNLIIIMLLIDSDFHLVEILEVSSIAKLCFCSHINGAFAGL